MNPFYKDNPFFNEHLTPDYMVDLKKMVQHYNEVLGDDFWKGMQKFNSRKRQQEPMIPTEIWENEQHLILLIVMPGIDVNQIKITYHSPKQITVQAKIKSIQPPEAQNLLSTELPRYMMTKNINLPLDVKTDQHSISTERNGVVTCYLQKGEFDKTYIDIPIDF